MYFLYCLGVMGTVICDYNKWLIPLSVIQLSAGAVVTFSIQTIFVFNYFFYNWVIYRYPVYADTDRPSWRNQREKRRLFCRLPFCRLFDVVCQQPTLSWPSFLSQALEDRCTSSKIGRPVIMRIIVNISIWNLSSSEKESLKTFLKSLDKCFPAFLFLLYFLYYVR